jgi:PAS domain S-box-containing protein
MARDLIRWKEEFIRSIRPDCQFHALFDHLQDVCLFAKDAEGRLLVVNQALVRRFGVRDERELIGKTDYDLHPRGHAEKYRQDDLRVMTSRKPMLNIVELFLDLRGVPTWHLTNKMPVVAHDGRLLGVMGTIETYEAKRTLGILHQSVLRAYEHIRDHFHEKISIRSLASRCKLSVRQFERTFRDQVWTSPRELIVRMRVHRACDLLRESEGSLLDVALSCGFYDQSSFNRHFRKHLGITPGEYRRRYG